MSGGDGSQTLDSTPPTPSSSKSVPVPFTFLGASSPSFRPSSTSPSLLSGKSPAAALTLACPRPGVVLCFLRLSFPAQLRRLIVRNSHSAFLAIHSAPSLPILQRACDEVKGGRELTDSQCTALLAAFVHLLPCRQLCPLEMWKGQQNGSQPSPLMSKVWAIPLPPPSSPVFSASGKGDRSVGLCVELRGALDGWSRSAEVGLKWLELFGVACEEEGEAEAMVEEEKSR